MFTRSVRILTAALLLCGATWAILDQTGRTSGGAPDPATRYAAVSLLGKPGAEAAAAIPDDFARTEGYRPALQRGHLVRPNGNCSTPVPVPRVFTTACRQHDLGYDLLRHAAAVGGPLEPSARRAIDDQFEVNLHHACERTGSGLSQLGCSGMAAAATWAVRVNTWRQHGDPPVREGKLAVATGTTGVLAVGAGAGLGLLGLARIRRFLARKAFAARLLAPRASTAVAVAVGTFAAYFPGSLPHAPLLQGAFTGLFVLVAVGLARLVRRPEPVLRGGRYRAVMTTASVVMVLSTLWFASTQNAMRAQIGWDPVGATYWLVFGGAVAAVLAFGAGLGRLWRHRRRIWRPMLVTMLAGWLILQPYPAKAAGYAVETLSPDDERVLTEPSATGAVRAYAAQRAGESLSARAERVAEDLVASGGLRRSRIVIMVPTGSGWVDPNAVLGLERRFGSDVAMVGMQYADTPSWFTYLFQREDAAQAAKALFWAVEDRVDDLPPGQRPDLHVHGESLGALAGQAIFADDESGGAAKAATCSVLWAGSPGGADTGPEHVTLVSNDDDPIVHTDSSLLYSPPGDDGGAWLPGVSFVQAGVDFVGSLAVPPGSGHVYGPEQAQQLHTCG